MNFEMGDAESHKDSKEKSAADRPHKFGRYRKLNNCCRTRNTSMVKNSSKITLKSLANGGVFKMYLAFFFLLLTEVFIPWIYKDDYKYEDQHLP